MESMGFCQEVLKCIRQKRQIEDEMVLYIIDDMSEQYVKDIDDLRGDEYGYIANGLEKMWQYRQFEDVSTEQSYLYGAMWGATKMLSAIRKKKETIQKSQTLVAKYDKEPYYLFLNLIRNKPGIKNKMLAEACDLTSARISQMTREALDDGLISMRAFGREKSYFMRTFGESVHEQLRRSREQLIERKPEVGYKMIFFSNEHDDFFDKVKNLYSTIDILDRECLIGIAVAYSEKDKELTTKMRNNLNVERNKTICKKETNFFTQRFMNFWEAQREVDMINQL